VTACNVSSWHVIHCAAEFRRYRHSRHRSTAPTVARPIAISAIEQSRQRKGPAEAGPLLGETPKLLLRALLAGLVVLPALLAALSWVLRLLAGLLVRLPALLLATLAALLILLAALVWVVLVH
jgi:hypothetical protein